MVLSAVYSFIVSMKKVIRHLPLHCSPPSRSHPKVGDLVGELPGHEAPQLRPVLAEEVALGAAREGADPEAGHAAPRAGQVEDL